MKLDESYIARRRFLSSMLGGGAVALGAGVGIPLTYYAGNLREDPPPPFLEIAEADYNLAPGKSKLIMYGRIPALLIRTPEPQCELKILVATCTHFDCTVGYQEDQNRIFCACHEGYYDLDGQVISGPPPEPLRPFYYKFEQSRLIIALEEANLEQAP